MRSRLTSVLCGLASGIVAGALPLSAGGILPASQLQAIKAQQPQRTLAALATARQAASNLGPAASFNIRQSFTTPEGRTVVRFQQTFQGHRVYGADAIAHVEANGAQQLLAQGTQSSVVPAGSPVLSAEQALATAKAHLKLKGATQDPKVELVVFPTSLVGDLEVKWDSRARRFVLDREASILSRPSDPYVWAYEVNVATWNREDGMTDTHLVVDARTGAILRRLNNLHSMESAGTPAKGKGLSQYSGAVDLDVMQATDGTFALRDLTRGSLPNAYFLRSEKKELTGLFTMWEEHEGGNPFDYAVWGKNFWYEGKAAATWGDGQPFAGYPHEGDANGETAGVDAQYALAQTWDFLKNVWGRNGIDGKGTTPFAQVHVRNQNNGMPMVNAFWNHGLNAMFCGDGDFSEDRALKDQNGQVYVIPGDPNGMKSLTELDVIAHEMGHGLTWETAGFSYGAESGGINEGASDIVGALVEAYAARPAGQDSVVPDGNDWMVGAKLSTTGPLRWMKKPSRDLLSADGWYEGLDWLDVHYSSGPLNRWFYYLSMGAPTSKTEEAFSPYLPGGMAGIGMDAAGRIWYKALSEYCTPQMNYHKLAPAVIQAAEALHGADSAQVLAVKQAFRAINVQVAGEPLLPRVTFPVIHVGGWIGQNPGSRMSRTTILPAGTTAQLNGIVTNMEDKRVAFKVGGHLGSAMQAFDPSGVGVVNPDGTWTAPYKTGFHVVTAYSVADPSQFAEGLVNIVNLDCDDDTEQDAVDMGVTALNYWLNGVLRPNASPVNGPWVDDMDADFYQTAIRTAWGVPQSRK